jgi:hypothetical protein
VGAVVRAEVQMLLVAAVLVLLLLLTPVLNAVQVELLQPQTDTPSTPLLHPVHTPHKEQTWL